VQHVKHAFEAAKASDLAVPLFRRWVARQLSVHQSEPAVFGHGKSSRRNCRRHSL